MATRGSQEKAKKERIRALYEQEQAMEVMKSREAMPAGEEATGPVRGIEPFEGSERGKHTPVSNREGRGAAPQEEAPAFGELGAPDGPVEFEVSDRTPGRAIIGTEAAPLTEPVDESLLLDAWYAEFSDPATRALLRSRPAGRDFLEIVIGEDDRTQVTNGVTKKYPWRCICSLRITAHDGSMWIGTAWLIGPHTLATAGHCIYIHDRGGWVRSIEVIPGRDGAERPFESVTATEFRSVTGWTDEGDRDFDYGAILLPPDQPLGDQLGWFGLVNESDARLNNLAVNLAGYPGDKPVGTQWFHARTLKRVTPSTIVYDIDTAGGQSGAPVWVLRGGNRHAVAIHTNGALSGNSGTRITEEVFNNLGSWKNEGE
jgi:V8-like Glu-specific endopeptidase